MSRMDDLPPGPLLQSGFCAVVPIFVFTQLRTFCEIGQFNSSNTQLTLRFAAAEYASKKWSSLSWSVDDVWLFLMKAIQRVMDCCPYKWARRKYKPTGAYQPVEPLPHAELLWTTQFCHVPP